MTTAADVVRTHYGIFNRGEFDAWLDVLTPDFAAHHASAGDTEGREVYLEAVRTYRQSFPDVTVELQSVIHSDGVAAARFTSRATFVHDFFDIRATGRPWELTGMGFYRIQDGKLAEAWWVEDLTGWLQRLRG